jgi:RimJ/RimL family protein N-acetyltransferase
MATVRLGRESDYAALFPLGQDFADFSPFGGTADPATLRKVFDASSDSGLLIVADVDSTVAGALVGMSVTQWYDPNMRIAVELAWWLSPEHRHGSLGLRLVRAFEAQAKSTGHKFCTMMTLNTPDAARLGALYERSGYRLTETAYMKAL